MLHFRFTRCLCLPRFSASDSSGQEEEEEEAETTVVKDNAKMKSFSESDAPSDDSLPRQSVMRRPPLPSTKPPSDYNPSSSSDSECSSQSRSESGSSSDEEEEGEERRSVYGKSATSHRRAHFGSDSDEEVEVELKKSAVKKKQVPFYSSNATSSLSVKSFYMNQEETQYGLPRRRVARNVRYNVYSDEESNSEQDSYNKRGQRRARGRMQDSGSDSEFQMSGDEDGAETFESESMTEETSSDGYTPYTRKRGGGGRKRKGKVR